MCPERHSSWASEGQDVGHVVDYGHALCRHLFAPNLIDITMRSGCRVQSKPAAHVLPVLDMLRSPSCPLPEVVTIDAYGRYNLDDEGPDYGEYLHVLARIPELRCLKLVYNHTGACHLESLLEGLIVKPDAPVLLPALNHLALRCLVFPLTETFESVTFVHDAAVNACVVLRSSNLTMVIFYVYSESSLLRYLYRRLMSFAR